MKTEQQQIIDILKEISKDIKDSKKFMQVLTNKLSGML